MKIFTTLITGAFLSACTVAVGCFDGPTAKLLSIGGSGGKPFCETRYSEGLFVKGIEVWTRKDYIVGIKLRYSNDDNTQVYGSVIDNHMIGKDGRAYKRLDWDINTGVKIDSLTLWGDGKGSRLGRIDMALSDGQSMNIGKEPDKKQESFRIDVGAGIMLGVWGYSGSDIDSLGFLFLRSKIEKVNIGDVVFDQDLEALREQRLGITKRVLQEMQHTNHLDVNTTYEFRRERTERNSKKIIRGMTNTWGLKVTIEFEAGIPLFAKNKVGVEGSWSIAVQRTTETETAEETKLFWGVLPVVKPGKTVYCSAWTEVGVFDAKYTSKVTFTLADGTSFSFKESGQYSSTTWGNAESECWYEEGGVKVLAVESDELRVQSDIPVLVEPPVVVATPTGSNQTYARANRRRQRL